MPAAAAKTKTSSTVRTAKSTIAPVIDIHTREEAPAGSMAIVAASTITDFSLRNAYFAEITPADAQRWLGSNLGNRAKAKSNLSKLGQDMRDGNFLLNGEAIIFASDGNLHDGQHRLTMCVETGATIVSVVVTGIAPEARPSIDTGIVRTLAHNIQMKYGMAQTQSSNLAAAIIITRSWEAGQRTHDGSSRLTVQQGLAWLEEHPELVELSAEATKMSAKLPGLTAKQVVAFYWAFDKLDSDDRRAFFDALATGIGLTEGDARLVLRNILIRDAAKRTDSGKMHPLIRMALTIKAWNAWRDNVPVKKITFRGGSKSEAFPEPR